MNGKAPNPYVGPIPFTTEDSSKFYGRESDLRRLMIRFVAQRIVLLYSPSGAGKTSLVQAKVIPALERKGFEVLPTIRVSQRPVKGSAETNRLIYSTINSIMEGEASTKFSLEGKNGDIADSDLIRFWQEQREALGNKRTVMFFDQFEEVITADPHKHGQKREFFDQLGEVLEKDVNLWALFAIQEDYLAELDPFRHLVPGELRDTYRLELLNKLQALEAIQKPAKAVEVTFADKAAERLIGQLSRVHVWGRDGQITFEEGPFVEPVHLQVVCQTLWEDLKPGAGGTIDVYSIAAQGHVDASLGQFYNETILRIAWENKVNQRDIRDWFDRELITERGLRGQVMGSEDMDLSQAVINDLVASHLIRAEERRGIPWYELAHDRLIGPVREHNEIWYEKNLSLLQRRSEAYKRSPDNELLLHSKQLKEAEAWAIGQELKDHEQNFLDASRAREKARRKRRWTSRAILILIIGLAVGMFVMWQATEDANEELAKKNEELTDAEEELTETNEELTETNEELTETNEELTDAEEELTETNEELTDAIEELEEKNAIIESRRLVDRAQIYLEDGNVVGALLVGGTAISTTTTMPAKRVLQEALQIMDADLPHDTDDASTWLKLACELARRNMTVKERQETFPGEEYQRTCPQYGVHISYVEEALLTCDIDDASERYDKAERPEVNGLPVDFDGWALPLLLKQATLEADASVAQACLQAVQRLGIDFDSQEFMQVKERLTGLTLDFTSDESARRGLQEVEVLNEQRNEWPPIVAASLDELLSKYYRELCVNLSPPEDANRTCTALNRILQRNTNLAHFIPITRTATTTNTQTYTFHGNYGDNITIEMEVREGDGKPQVTVLDANDNLPIFGQDAEAGALSGVVLPRTGDYFIALTETPLVRSLSLKRTEPVPVSMNSTTEAAAEARVWRFEGNADDLVTIIMEALPQGDPLLKLRDGTGRLIQQNDDFGGKTNSRIQVQLPADSVYFIDAGWYTDTLPVPYRLTVSRVENLMLGDAVEATAEQREWMFEGNRDDFVIVTMEALDENDGPILRLLDENGIVISASEGGPGSEAVLDTIRLPDDGIYFLNTGWEGTPGRYQVSLDRVEPDRFAPGGTIQNASAEQRLWAFEGDSGEIVTVIMEAQDEQGVPLLKLRDEFGEVIASAEHGDDHIASICSIWLPTTGRYVVETGWKARPGNYTLSLTRIELESRKLEFGDTLENVPPEQCIWQFKGNRGDFVAIAIDAQDPSGDPLLALLDENGGEITFNDDVDTDLNPRLEAVLPTTGTYLINTDWIGPPGPYSLSLARVEPITITISDVPESAGPGQSLWQFEGNQGDFLTIAMDTLDLDGNPLLTLYNEAGQVIEVSDHGGVGRNALLHVILQKDSSYIINAGWMSQPASYTLALNQIDVGLLNLPAAEREADPDQWAWRFEGERGDYVTIAMDAVEDEGDPLLRLYDENGQFVAENDDNYRLNALLQLSLPESGVYFIDAGWFSNPGRYRLTLRQTNVEVDVESVAADSRQEALQLIKNGDVEEGLSLFKEVELIEASLPTTLLSARDYNWVCWYGSLWDYTAEVMFACEVAAKREPENGGFANSRGVARALTGDLEGAIDDFRAYLGWGLGGNNELRQEWIEELEAGRNPFDDEALLEHLRNEE